ncbi:hypothetical protein PISMIDRAFT_684974 [Pisolithus microcarpus 441]|uniref:Uncharacterized protein n=1 Tax=Pisolithus microcarpus 441 TaxID=765257 RepID=A0A0C9ZCP0_9AGAM|nr:hypothetical protein PISMIDRAFT_684974 [Pisolithus microcarpus 441]
MDIWHSMIRKVLWLYSPMIIPQRVQTLRHLECHCRQLLPSENWTLPGVTTHCEL